MTPDGSPMIDPERGRRVDLALESDLQLGPMRVSPAAREVVSGERRELLEPRIMQVLVRLARTPGVVVSRDELITCCWEGRIVGEDAINRVIAKLRRLSEQDDGAAFTIETIPRVGYRLWPAGKVSAPAPVVQVAPPVAVAQPTQLPAPPRSSPGAPGRGPSRAGVRLWRAATGVLVLLLTGSAGVYAAGGLRPAQPVTLAVLPFQDISSGDNRSAFAEGVAEEIQAALSHEDSLTVIGRTSARQFKDEADLGVIRKALGVSHVLEGSVQSQGQRLRMNVRLVKTADGAQLWAQSFERPATDVFATQDEIAAEVARALKGRFALPANTPEAPKTELQTYDLVLAARARLREGRPDDVAAALGMLRRAVALDPQYGPAWAALAEATLAAADGVDGAGRIPFKQAKADARRFAERAVKLAPDRAEGYAARARAGVVETALSDARKAVELDGSSAANRVRLAEVLSGDGRYTDAAAELKAAVTVDPLYDGAHVRLAYLQAQLGRFQEAEATAARYDALYRRPVEAAMVRAYIAAERGDWSEAIRLAERAHGYPDAYYRADLLGRGYRLLGLSERARRLSELTTHPFEAAVYAGDDRRALEHLASLGDAAWEEPIRRWMAADLLSRANRPAELLAVFDARYRTGEAYCSRQEYESALPMVAALQGAARRTDAEAILRCVETPTQLDRKDGVSRGRNGFILAQIAALRGRRDQAVAWLERAYREGYRGELYGDLRDRVAFRRLDGDPRFEELRAVYARAAQAERDQVLKAGARPL